MDPNQLMASATSCPSTRGPSRAQLQQIVSKLDATPPTVVTLRFLRLDRHQITHHSLNSSMGFSDLIRWTRAGTPTYYSEHSWDRWKEELH